MRFFFCLHDPMFSRLVQCRLVTDRWTHDDSIYRASTASRGKKNYTTQQRTRARHARPSDEGMMTHKNTHLSFACELICICCSLKNCRLYQRRESTFIHKHSRRSMHTYHSLQLPYKVDKNRATLAAVRQRILTKGRITGGGFFTGNNVM